MGSEYRFIAFSQNKNEEPDRVQLFILWHDSVMPKKIILTCHQVYTVSFSANLFI